MKNLSKVLNEKDIATKEYVDTASSNKANINSPTFTGSPTTPTPTQSTTGKVLVNQEYVANSVSGYLPLTGGILNSNEGQTEFGVVAGNESTVGARIFSEKDASGDMTAQVGVLTTDETPAFVGIYANTTASGKSVGIQVMDTEKGQELAIEPTKIIMVDGQSGNTLHIEPGSISGLSAPLTNSDATNKKYVDDTVLGAKPLAKELHFYGDCLSAANEANKVVTVSDDNFKLMSGVAVDVSFLNANTASRPTLNVNNTGAVEIKAYSTTVPLANQWRQGAVVRFVYNTSNWVMVDGSVASTTYYGATKLNSSTSSTSEDTAATPLAVKQAYDRGSTALTMANAAVPKSSLLRFTNVTFVANTGVTDTTYDGYTIRYDVSCTDVTTDYSADVRFAPADAVSGNFAPFCDTGNGIVKIYAKQAVKDNGGNITIPVIICTKMVD